MAVIVKQAADEGRRVSLFIDELSQVATAWHWKQELGLLFRAHAHCGLSIFCTSQYAGDVPPVAMNCCENTFCFCTTSPRAIKKMTDTFQFEPEILRNLQVGEYLQASR